MLNKVARCAVLVGLPMLCYGQADPALKESGILSRRAAAISELHTADLERQAEQQRRHDKAAGQQKVGSEAKTRPKIAHLIDIAGSGDSLVATFQLPDGDVASFTTGETVPGFGRIGSISPEDVTDAVGRAVHPQTPPDRRLKKPTSRSNPA